MENVPASLLVSTSNPVYFLRSPGISPHPIPPNGFFQGTLSSQFITSLVIPLSIKDLFYILCFPLVIAQLFLSFEVNFLEKQSVLCHFPLDWRQSIHTCRTLHQNHAAESHKWFLGCQSQRALFSHYFTSLFGICHC